MTGPEEAVEDPEGQCRNFRPAEVEQLPPLDLKDEGREQAWTVEALEAMC